VVSATQQDPLLYLRPEDLCKRPAKRSTAAATGVGPAAKTNPIEAIEVKPCSFYKMHHILINRTHWTYLPCLQMVTEKIRPISGNYADRHAPGFLKGRARALPYPNMIIIVDPANKKRYNAGHEKS
jgi:hypothetical protein